MKEQKIRQLKSALEDIENILLGAAYAQAHMDSEFPRVDVGNGVTCASPTYEAIKGTLQAMHKLHEFCCDLVSLTREFKMDITSTSNDVLRMNLACDAFKIIHHR